MTHFTSPSPTAPEHRPRALLVGTYPTTAEKVVCEEHLAELSRLADTYGVDTTLSIAAPIRTVDSATYLGSGKVEEMVAIAAEQRIDLVIFDDEISPAQQRNLEKLFKITVMERREVIMGVFAKHAQTREARLQIEMAQVKYQFPRLKRLWTHLERQVGAGGGGVYLKGAGEKQIELDRRMLEQREKQLLSELAEVRRQRETQRSARQRSGVPTFAIVGYTNAGKSTLLNALTDAGVLVEDKLFATLDTTTRRFNLPNKQQILLIDTVGFIRKLPHQLVAAFKSTLEEAVYADILLHVVDVSHPMALEQASATLAVLKELHADKHPVITVLNKVDLCDNHMMVDRMRALYGKVVTISSVTRDGFDDLLLRMVEELSRLRKEVRLQIPQSQYALVSEVLRQSEVIYREYEGDDVILRARVPSQILYKVEPYIKDVP